MNPLRRLPAAAALAAAVAAGLAWSPTWDFDVWFHLACGNAMLDLGGLPRHDLFSFTAADRAWDAHEWLSQLVFALTWRAGGLPALAGLKVLVTAATFAALVVLTGRRRGPGGDRSLPWIAAGCAVAAAYVIRWHLVERPHMFSHLFLVLELGWLASGAPRWRLIPLTLLWANLHGGSALIAPGVAGLWVGGEAIARWRRGEPWRPWLAGQARWGTAVLAAVAVNPAGVKLYGYPFETMSHEMYMLNVREWTPPALAEQPGFFVLLAGLLAAAVAARRFWTPPDALVATAFVALALDARRHIPLCCLALVPPVASGLAGRFAGVPAARGRAFLPALAAAAGAVLLGIAAARGEALRGGVREEFYPVGAARRLAALEGPLAADGPVRVFGLHQWGGYLLWSLPESFKVFIDGRQLVYGEDLFVDYYKILDDRPEATALLDRHDPDAFLLDYRHGRKLSQRLAADPGVALVHWDDVALLFLRRRPALREAIARMEYRHDHPLRDPGPDLEPALADLERAAGESPGHSRPVSMKASLFLAHGRPRDAWLAAREALRLAPRTFPVLLTACEAAQAMGDLVEARALLKRARKVDPSGTGSSFAAARLHLLAGHTDEAAGEVERAIRLGERWRERRGTPEVTLGDAYRLRASRALAERRAKDAAEAFRRAGNVFFELGRMASAERAYRDGLRAAESDVRLWHNLGSLHLRTGRPAEAARSYRRALSIDPSHLESLVSLGVARWRLREFEEARGAWRDALDLDPGRDDVRAFLGLPDTPPGGRSAL